MKVGNQLKPQDVLILLKLLTRNGKKPWRYAELAQSLEMSQSEVHSAIKRAEQAKLYDPLTRLPIRNNLIEFLVSGAPYAFAAKVGKQAKGIPTAHSTSPLREKIVSDKNDAYVWPSRFGKVKGLEVEPLYKSAPQACLKDEKLYEILALLDALRVGRSRERDLAKKLLAEGVAAA